MEGAKNTTSFLAFFILVCIVTLMMTDVAFNMTKVFWHFILILFCYLGSIDPSG